MEILTVKQVAEKLGVSRYKVYELIETGVLKAVKLGTRSMRISEDEITRLFGGHQAISEPTVRYSPVTLLPEGYIGMKEAIVLLKYSYAGVWQLVKKGELKTIRKGKRIFLERKSVDQFIEKSREGFDWPVVHGKLQRDFVHREDFYE